MWVAKIKIYGKEALIGSKCFKHKIDLFGFPLSYYYEKDCVVVHITGTIIGKEKDKKIFVNELKKEARVVNFELNNDFFIGTIKEPPYTRDIYNKNIIHLAPALISQEGYELINVGSFNRANLIKMSNIFKKTHKGKLISIQNKKIKSISVMKVHPDLTEKQKQAITLAMKEGYYNSPRKIDVKELAKLSKLSYATYQVHLRKAEQKLMPYFFE